MRILFTFFILFIFISCSSVFDSDPDEMLSVDLKKGERQICLSGEGRGRIKYLDESYTFSYEMNLFDRNVWEMAFDFPLHGEEILSLHFNNLPKGRIHLSGEFVERVHNSLIKKRSGQKKMRLIDAFFQQLGLFLMMKRGGFTNYSCVQDNKQGLVKHGTFCLDKKVIFKWSTKDYGKLKFFSSVRDRYQFEIEFFNAEICFKRITIRLYKKGHKKNQLIELSLLKQM